MSFPHSLGGLAILLLGRGLQIGPFLVIDRSEIAVIVDINQDLVVGGSDKVVLTIPVNIFGLELNRNEVFILAKELRAADNPRFGGVTARLLGH